MSPARLATPFRERAGAALHDAFLKEALAIATTKFISLRREAFAGFPEGEALRDRARAIKEATLQRLDQYLEQLIARIEARGGHVHYATTAGEARAVILEIARRAGARMVVKSKSMATEEIELNEALLHAGITPVETDLGEYIIQLAGERPSHIIAPAIHKTKGQVAELFTRALGRTVPADPEGLTRVARAELREKFLQADMGITGANFAVADTGTIVLVTNEGNGRMVTSLPRVHVAVMGVEKVVPSMSDLVVFLAILAKSATGQKLSAYTTLVQGPRSAGELEGPEEFHLVLLDNGRIDQIDGPLRESLACLRCGACLNVCPVYRQIGGHAYGHTYPGPIGILLTAMQHGTPAVKELAHASSLCGACAEVCPVRIDIPRMLVELRREIDEQRIAPWAERILFQSLAVVFTRPALYRLVGPLGRLLQRPFARGRMIRRRALVFGRWTRTRDLPAVAPRTFSELWGELEREAAVTTKAEFLTRIRRQMQRAPAVASAAVSERPVHPAQAVEIVQRQPAERWRETLERFREEFERVGGVFHWVGALADVPDVVRRLARERQARRLISWHPAALGIDWSAALASDGLAVVAMPLHEVTDASTRAALRGQIAEADLGLTGVDLVVAETGSLVLISGRGRPRSTSLLPPCHVAVFTRDALVESLAQVGLALEAWHGEARPEWAGGAITVITGPSRTADIELTLTRGVHGPRELHAIFVDSDVAAAGGHG